MTSKTIQQESPEKIQQRLSETSARLEEIERKLLDARGNYGEQVLTGDAKLIASAYARISGLQAEEVQQRAALLALERRLAAAQEREEAQSRDAQWEALREALEHRHKVFARLEEIKSQFVPAVTEALDAAAAVWPVASIAYGRPAGSGVEEHQRAFEWLNLLRQEEVVMVRKSLEDLEARSRKDGAALLSLRVAPPSEEKAA